MLGSLVRRSSCIRSYTRHLFDEEVAPSSLVSIAPAIQLASAYESLHHFSSQPRFCLLQTTSKPHHFWLVRLLDEVFEKVITTAVETSENLQTFSAQRTRWLEEERETDSRSYIIKDTLRDLMRVKDDEFGLFGKSYVLDGYYDVCECVHSDDMDDDEENDDDEQKDEDDDDEDADNEEEDED